MAFSALGWLRDISLRAASVNVVLGDRMAALVASKGVYKRQIAIVPNWGDGSNIRPLAPENNPLREVWQLEHAFVVGYSGNLGRALDVATIIAAIEKVEAADSGASPPDRSALRHRNPPVRWLFIGSRAQLQVLKAAVSERRLTSVLFQPYQPLEMLAHSLSVPDVHLISLKPELEGLIVPSKLYGIAAAGRPAIFIGDPEGEIGRIIRRHDIGCVVREGDGEALARAVLGLRQDADSTAKAGERARALFEQAYDLPRAIRRWEDVLAQVADDAH